MSERCVVFVDNNNMYCALRDVYGLRLWATCYPALFQSLMTANRRLIESRVYLGKLRLDAPGYSGQLSFIQTLECQPSLIMRYGTVVERPRDYDNPTAKEVARVLHSLKRKGHRLPDDEYEKLVEISQQQTLRLQNHSEKAVDVLLSVDLITESERYDVAYLLSGDGDFVPAVDRVRSQGKTVFLVTPKGQPCDALKTACNSHIQLDEQRLLSIGARPF